MEKQYDYMIAYKSINKEGVRADNMSTLTLNYKIRCAEDINIAKNYILSKEPNMENIVIQNFILLRKHWVRSNTI